MDVKQQYHNNNIRIWGKKYQSRESGGERKKYPSANPGQGFILLESKLEVMKFVLFCKIGWKKMEVYWYILTLLHSKQPKLHRVLAVLCAVGLNQWLISEEWRPYLSMSFPLRFFRYYKKQVLTLLQMNLEHPQDQSSQLTVIKQWWTSFRNPMTHHKCSCFCICYKM